MKAHAKAPSRRATQTALEEIGSHQQRTQRAYQTRQVIHLSVPDAPASRQFASPTGEKFSRLCALILANNAALADGYGDALQLVVGLHDEDHPLAPLARSVALTIIEWAGREHRAADLAALAAEAAGEEPGQWA